MSLNAQIIPKIVIDLFIQNGYLRQGNSETEFGLWVNSKDNKPENAFLVIGRGDAMRERFGDIMPAPTHASILPFILEISNLGFFQPFPPI
jgi:hypothetical protein